MHISGSYGTLPLLARVGSVGNCIIAANNYKKLLTFAKDCTIVYLSVLLVCVKICGYVWLQMAYQEQTFLYKFLLFYFKEEAREIGALV